MHELGHKNLRFFNFAKKPLPLRGPRNNTTTTQFGQERSLFLQTQTREKVTPSEKLTSLLILIYLAVVYLYPSL